MRRQLVWLFVVLLVLTPMVGCAGGESSSSQAEQALQSFAQEQLGLAIRLRYAGDVTAAVEKAIAAMPAEVQTLLAMVPEGTDVQNYAGLMEDGVAMLSLGTCAQGETCSASLGIYALRVAKAMPADAEAALAMIRRTFPKTGELALTALPGAETEGYLFFVVLPAVERSGQPAVSARSVIAGVAPAGTQTVVYAAVGVGSFSSLNALPLP